MRVLMNSPSHSESDAPWPRAIILVDMNAFFCSVEQMDHPEWQGRPIAVTNGSQGTCIITSSYEARAYGIRTGMRLIEARRLCPDLIQVPAHPERYAAVSSNIMDALTTLSPMVEVFSVDEAFLDVTQCQRYVGAPEQIARQVKQLVSDVSGGVLCSVGVSGDKTTAKYAAKLNKPDGLTLIPPHRAAETLMPVPVTELCGIGTGIGRYLAMRGVLTCGDMQRLPIGELAARFGNLGRRIWLMAQGLDPDTVKTTVAAPKTIGHGKVMPPNTTDPQVIRTFLLHMAQKVAARLRRHAFTASHFYIGLNTRQGWLSDKPRHHPATDQGADIMRLCYGFLSRFWSGEPVHQVQITALNPQPREHQADLFDSPKEQTARLARAMDAINNRYGEFALAPGALLNRSQMPNVIAPAWKPNGHRETILANPGQTAQPRQGDQDPAGQVIQDPGYMDWN